MSDSSPHTFFYESKQADVACDLPKEGIAVAFRQSDGGSIAAVIIPQAQHKANLERIRQLEIELAKQREKNRQDLIELDNYKSAWIVTDLYGYRIYQPDGDVSWRYTRPDGTESELLPTWWLAARRAMKEVHTAAAGIAAEYLEGGGK